MGCVMKAALWLISLVLISCTGKQWSASHPYYQGSPSAAEEIALLGLERSTVITRDKWFAKNLEIPRDSVYTVLKPLLESAFVEELKNSRYPKLILWPDSLYETFPAETQKLDKRIYIKGKFPAQGVKISVGEKAPARLILVHEWTLGLDLSKENFYDYALINNEVPEKRTANSLTVLMTYTLWDNENQRALYSAIAEIPLKLSDNIQLDDLKKISAAAADSLIYGIDGGSK